MIGFSADREWFIIRIKVKILKFVLFGRLIRNRWWILLQFPIFKTFVWEGEDLILNGGIEYDFMEWFSFIDDLCDFFSSIFADDMDGIKVNLCISFIIDILEFSDGISSWVFFLMSFDWVNFDHLIGPFPENVNSWIVIDWHDDSDLNIVFSAFFVSGEF